MQARRALVALVILGGCSRPANDAPPPAKPAAAPVLDAAAPAPLATRAPAPTPPADAAAPAVRYPVGAKCARPAAIAEERRTLPPARDWKAVTSAKQRLAVHVPAGVFTVKDGADALVLVGADKATMLGGDGAQRHFQITLRRVARSVDALLANDKRGPLEGAYVEGAFPKRTVASFVPQPDEEEPGSGTAVRWTLGERPAWTWITGVEGYDTDYTLVDLGKDDTAVVVADWNSSIMLGQPECWQRAIIGGVVESLVAR